MSTKIYNIYKYKKNIFNLMEFLKETRERWHEESYKKILNYVNKESKGKEVSDFFIKESNSTNWSEYDIKGSITVIPFKNRILVQFFLGLNNCEDYINDDFVDYHYQNSSDPYYEWEKEENKKNMNKKDFKNWYSNSKREYNRREIFYDELYSKYGSPAEVGITYELMSDLNIMILSGQAIGEVRKR